MFSGSFGVRSIVLCTCSGNVLIGYNYANRTVAADIAYFEAESPHTELLDIGIGLKPDCG